MLGCNQDITLWKRKKIPATSQEIFVRHVIPVKCKWKDKIIIVPYCGAVSELNIKDGDVAALGVYDIDITGATPYTVSEVKQLLAPNIITVKSVTFNCDTEMKGKHLRLTGN